MTLEPIKRGETVYTVLRHCSRTGMYRIIDLIIIRDGEPVSALAAVPDEKAAEFREIFPRHKQEDGYVVRGCGMDMGFHVVYTLSQILFRGETSEPRTNKDDGKGGYALIQRWI